MKNRFAQVAVIRVIAAGYAAGVLVLGLIPMGPLPLPKTFVPQDKLMHAAVFAGFALLLALVARGNRGVAWAVGGATAFGGLLELLQALVPYRSADWYDLAADAVGAGLGGLLAAGASQLKNPASDPRNQADR